MKFCSAFYILLTLYSQKSDCPDPLKEVLLCGPYGNFWLTVFPVETPSIVSENDESGLPTRERGNISISNRLSRQRQDFSRASPFSKGRLPNDARLTDYFSRVQRRVRGELAPSETIRCHPRG